MLEGGGYSRRQLHCFATFHVHDSCGVAFLPAAFPLPAISSRQSADFRTLSEGAHNPESVLSSSYSLSRENHDTTNTWTKIPSQNLSDALTHMMRDHIKD